MKQQRTQAIPVLRIFDIAKAHECYINWTGFRIDWEHRFEENFPLYRQISKEDIVLHLTEHYGDCTPGAKVFLRITNLDEWCDYLCRMDYRYYKPGIERAEWGARILLVTDPFGNKLLFNQDNPS